MTRLKVMGAGVCVCVCLIAVLGPAASLEAGTSGPSQRRLAEESPEQGVRSALGYLTYVLRSGDPSLVASEFASLIAPGASAVNSQEVAAFFDAFRPPPGAPLFYIANPVITIDGVSANVACIVHWRLLREDGIVLTFKESERLVFELIGERFELRNARSTPLVVKHFEDKAAYVRALMEVDRAMAIGESH